MSDTEILESLIDGNFLVTGHALERMFERGLLEIDIRSAARTCSAITLQNHGTWKVDGRDASGERLAVIAAEEAEILIVTIFKDEGANRE